MIYFLLKRGIVIIVKKIDKKCGIEMQRLLNVLGLILLLSACTKEVPESDKKLIKSVDEKSIQETLDNYYLAVNAADIDKAASFIDVNYRSILPDMNDVTGINQFKDNLKTVLSKYPNGKWNVKISEINSFGDLAYIYSIASVTVNNELHIEKALRILKKQKNDGWKFYRVITLQNPDK